MRLKKKLCMLTAIAALAMLIIVGVMPVSVAATNNDVEVNAEGVYKLDIVRYYNPDLITDHPFSEENFSFNETSEYKYQVLASYVKNDSIGQTIIYVNATLLNALSLEYMGVNAIDGRLVVTGLMTSDTQSWNVFYASLKYLLTGLSGIAFLTCTLAFVLATIRLAMAAGNPPERGRSIRAMVWTGIGSAGCGAVTLIFVVAYNLIK